MVLNQLKSSHFITDYNDKIQYIYYCTQFISLDVKPYFISIKDILIKIYDGVKSTYNYLIGNSLKILS